MVIFASTYEGFGLPIIEANAVGRPVVTSDIYSMPEVAGDAACLVNPFDVSNIRTGVLRVIQDESYRRKLIENGFKNVERFKPNAIAQQYLELYKELFRKSHNHKGCN
jgi:glycosyltransferase involved in cell wall biosynthesis